MNKAILRIECPDKQGIVHEITGFIVNNKGNILELEQFVDQRTSRFFMRVVWDMTGFGIPFEEFEAAFAETSDGLKAKYWINSSARKDRLALFVSKELHCLGETLMQSFLGNLPVEIPVIIGNHEKAGGLAEKFGVKFFHIPTEGREREECEQEQLRILEEQRIDFIGLARYMRILSKNFVRRYEDRIINIHHSFLPAFVGANPYRQAYDRGVKIIGATAHFVTEELDRGAIIAQDVMPVHHGYSVERLRQVGQETEKKVFSFALKKYAKRKIIRIGNRTIVFE
jgi:formyltetrahydrofolate deformylase